MKSEDLKWTAREKLLRNINFAFCGWRHPRVTSSECLLGCLSFARGLFCAMRAQWRRLVWRCWRKRPRPEHLSSFPHIGAGRATSRLDPRAPNNESNLTWQKRFMNMHISSCWEMACFVWRWRQSALALIPMSQHVKACLLLLATRCSSFLGRRSVEAINHSSQSEVGRHVHSKMRWARANSVDVLKPAKDRDWEEEIRAR